MDADIHKYYINIIIILQNHMQSSMYMCMYVCTCTYIIYYNTHNTVHIIKSLVIMIFSKTISFTESDFTHRASKQGESAALHPETLKAPTPL